MEGGKWMQKMFCTCKSLKFGGRGGTWPGVNTLKEGLWSTLNHQWNSFSTSLQRIIFGTLGGGFGHSLLSHWADDLLVFKDAFSTNTYIYTQNMHTETSGPCIQSENINIQSWMDSITHQRKFNWSILLMFSLWSNVWLFKTSPGVSVSLSHTVHLIHNMWWAPRPQTLEKMESHLCSVNTLVRQYCHYNLKTCSDKSKTHWCTCTYSWRSILQKLAPTSKKIMPWQLVSTLYS